MLRIICMFLLLSVGVVCQNDQQLMTELQKEVDFLKAQLIAQQMYYEDLLIQQQYKLQVSCREKLSAEDCSVEPIPIIEGGGSQEFLIEGSTINHLSQIPAYQQLFDIPLNIKSFRFLIVETNSRPITIGVIDRNYKNDPYTNINNQQRPHNIVYVTNANVLGEGRGIIKTEGSGFQNGDEVGMDVDLLNGVVSWSVNAVPQTRHHNPELSNPNIEWVPYLLCYTRGQKVKFLEMS